MSVRLLFPSYSFEYDLIREGFIDPEYLKDLATEIVNMRKSDPAGRFVSNAYTGWQSNDGCESNSKFTKLFRTINSITQHEVLPFFGFNPANVQLQMGNCWANINDPQAFNRPHTHNGCWYSGVFYIQCDGDEGDLVAIDTDAKVVSDFPHGRRMDTSWNQKPVAGKMILFPSGLMHLVEPNITDKDRISIAFNLNTKYLSNRNDIQLDPMPDTPAFSFELDQNGNPIWPESRGNETHIGKY